MLNLFRSNSERNILLLALILFASIVGAYAFNSKLVYLAFAICVFFMITSKDACDVLIPFSIVVTWGAEIWGLGSNHLYTFLKLLMMGIFFIKLRMEKKAGGNVVAFLICLSLFTLYVFVGDFLSTDCKELMQIINLFLCYLIVFFYCSSADSKNLQLLSFSFGIGTALSACIYWMGFLIPSLNEVVLEMLQTANTFGDFEVGRLSAMTYDPNLYGFFVVISMSLNICIMYRKKYKGVFWNAILTLFLFVLGMMTLSKAFFLVGGMVLAIFVWLLFRSNNVSRSAKAYVTVVLIVALFAFIYYLGFYFELFAERFKGDDASDVTTGRSNLWVFYLNYLFDNPGVLFTGATIGGKFDDYSTPHNFIIYLLYFFGVFGTLFYVLMISSLIKVARRINPLASRHSHHIMLLPIVAYFVYILSIDPFMLYDIKIMTLTCCITSLIIPIEKYEIKHSTTSL